MEDTIDRRKVPISHLFHRIFKSFLSDVWYAVVTGENKGIGLEICRQLATKGIRVILTARSSNKGIEAVEELRASGLKDVVFHQLDVKDPSSIASLANFIETNFKKLDILVNNAGEGGVIIYADEFLTFKDGAGFAEVTDENAHLLPGIIEQSYEMAESCLKTNYYGTKGVTEALVHLLQRSNSPTIVNISSNIGQLKELPNEKVKEELETLESLSENKIDVILQRFLENFKDDKLQMNGWPITLSAYKMSKIAVNAYTRLVARKFPNFLVNCVHPGYVVTDITANTGYLTPEEGARAPVMAALLPDGGPSGKFFLEMQESDF